METLLMHPSLTGANSQQQQEAARAFLTANLPVRTARQHRQTWDRLRATHQRTVALINKLGKPTVTKDQAKRLDSLGLGYEELVSLRARCKSVGEFLNDLACAA